ncbi:hypothetical protein D3C79_1084760 [compost metagenome]
MTRFSVGPARNTNSSSRHRKPTLMLDSIAIPFSTPVTAASVATTIITTIKANSTPVLCGISNR